MLKENHFVLNPPSNRLIGELPKIGIRPVIDGRRHGIRESLESPTLAMAEQVAKLLTSNLRHACGLPVECVVSDTCIGGVAEAAQAADKFSRERVGVSITVTPCWCYGSETMSHGDLRFARTAACRGWPTCPRDSCRGCGKAGATNSCNRFSSPIRRVIWHFRQMQFKYPFYS